MIGEPGLDAAEQALEAELAATDQRLERLLRQSQQRRMPTPEPAPAAAIRAAVAPAVVLGVPAAAVLSPASVLQPAARQPSPQPLEQAAVAPGLAAAPQAVQPQPQGEEPAIPLQDQSIVRSVVTSTGTGCKDIIAPHTAAVLPPGACWTSRGHRTLRLESAAILQLWGRTKWVAGGRCLRGGACLAAPCAACSSMRLLPHCCSLLQRRICLPPLCRCSADVTLRITFADAASVPFTVRLEHAPTPTAAFERLGDIRLQAKSLTQLKHLFRWAGRHSCISGRHRAACMSCSWAGRCCLCQRTVPTLCPRPCCLRRLGKSLEVQRCLRITLLGHMAEEDSGGCSTESQAACRMTATFGGVNRCALIKACYSPAPPSAPPPGQVHTASPTCC